MDQSNKEKSHSQDQQKNYQNHKNYRFHKGELKFVKDNIQSHIKNWRKYSLNSKELQQFYHDLEYDHSFIQWIFPNFFNSMFNSDSYRLTLQERNFMISDKQIMDQYLSNYQMFLKFLGIEKQQDQFNLIDKDQFRKCIFVNVHNQLRLKRVLASLSVLGQREEALRFLQFLQQTFQQLKQQTNIYQQYSTFEQVQEELIFLNNEVQQYEEKEIKTQQIEKQDNNNDIKSDLSNIDQLQQEQKQQQQQQQQQSQDLEQPYTETEELSALTNNQNQQEVENNNQQQQQLINLSLFKDRKNYYIQSDLLNQKWVTERLLTKKQC